MINKAHARKLYIPTILFFICANAFLFIGKNLLVKWNIDPSVVIAGNLLLFIVSFLSLFFYHRAMLHGSTAGFLRNTYSGIMIKLFTCMIVVLIYAVSVGGKINKAGIFVCVFLYLLYAIIEMRGLLRWNKARNNA